MERIDLLYDNNRKEAINLMRSNNMDKIIFRDVLKKEDCGLPLVLFEDNDGNFKEYYIKGVELGEGGLLLIPVEGEPFWDLLARYYSSLIVYYAIDTYFMVKSYSTNK